MIDAQNEHRGLDCVPLYPCPAHGPRPVLEPDCDHAWSLYQRMSQHRQFRIEETRREQSIERKVFLDYRVIDMLLSLYVEPEARPDVFEQLEIIHDTLYPRELDV